MNNSNQNPIHINNDISYTILQQDDLEKQSLLQNNYNNFIVGSDKLSNYGSNDSRSSSSSHQGGENTNNNNNYQYYGCCSSDSSCSSDGHAMRTFKSIFFNNLFCKICLLLVCLIAIYTLIAIKCNGIGFDGCRN